VKSDQHIDALGASRKRLLEAAEDERRQIERRLHDGVHQQLVALAVNLQLAGALIDSDLVAAKKLLEEMGRDVHETLAEITRLAQRLYPPLDVVGLAATLRAAATAAGARASVDVDLGEATSYPRGVMEALYLCWLETLEQVADGRHAAITIRNQSDGLTFEILAAGRPALEPLRDRVEALGGELSARPEPEGCMRIAGALPVG
jgi:signal transduction histidine kinase